MLDARISVAYSPSQEDRMRSNRVGVGINQAKYRRRPEALEHKRRYDAARRGGDAR